LFTGFNLCPADSGFLTVPLRRAFMENLPADHPSALPKRIPAGKITRRTVFAKNIREKLPWPAVFRTFCLDCMTPSHAR